MGDLSIEMETLGEMLEIKKYYRQKWRMPFIGSSVAWTQQGKECVWIYANRNFPNWNEKGKNKKNEIQNRVSKKCGQLQRF